MNDEKPTPKQQILNEIIDFIEVMAQYQAIYGQIMVDPDNRKIYDMDGNLLYPVDAEL